ncbi:MAG: hypothetical protein JXJ17_14870 [Anaerolineae bacterium]|nr:hypothetical protein [Anaerolineae bacterium]
MSEGYTGELPENERPVEAPKVERSDYSSDRFEYKWRTTRHHPDFMRHHHRQDGGLASWSSIFWAALLIVAGAVLLAWNMGMLPAGTEPWDWIMLGAGGLLLLKALIRVILPNVSGPSIFNIIAGCVLIGIGLGNTFGLDISFEQWWPVILIAIGLTALGSAFRR